MSNQLLPCPFCGGEPRLVPEDYEDKHGRPEPHAECDHCDLAIPLHTWNRRATQPAAGEPVATRLRLPTPEQVMHVVMKFQWEDRKNGTGTTNWAANLGMAVVEYVASMNPAPPAAEHGDEPVGEASSMPGSNGFTLAVFKAEDVPVGTKLYTYSKKDHWS